MINPTNYYIAWGVYIAAGCFFYAFFWRVTRFQQQRGLSYFLRALMLAIIATPWYVSDTGSAMAPALIIVLMDAITIGGEAAVRAFVPLFLAIILALVAALVLMLLRRGRGRGKARLEARQQKKQARKAEKQRKQQAREDKEAPEGQSA